MKLLCFFLFLLMAWGVASAQPNEFSLARFIEIDSAQALEQFQSDIAARFNKLSPFPSEKTLAIRVGKDVSFEDPNWKKLLQTLPRKIIVLWDFTCSSFDDVALQKFLKNFHGLLYLNIRGSFVTDIQPLVTDNADRVMALEAGVCQVGDLSRLASLVHLRILAIGASVNVSMDSARHSCVAFGPVTRDGFECCNEKSPAKFIPTDLAFARDLTKLAALSLPEHCVTDFSPLMEKAALRRLCIGSIVKSERLPCMEKIEGLGFLRLEDDEWNSRPWIDALGRLLPRSVRRLQIWETNYQRKE